MRCKSDSLNTLRSLFVSELTVTSKPVYSVRSNRKGPARKQMLDVFVETPTISIKWPAAWQPVAILLIKRVSRSKNQKRSLGVVADCRIEAISINTRVCSNNNATIPNYVGCSPSLASLYHFSASSPAQSSSSIQSGMVATGSIQPAITIPSKGPVAMFTGGPILTGSCTTPQYASATLDDGGMFEYPWLGCSYEQPGCCPFDLGSGGSLDVCPGDYITTSGACCPS